MKRMVYLDYLRLIATVSVIGVHTVSLASSMTEQGSPVFYVLELFDFAFLSCNLLFIFMSGALLLSVKGERPGTFFQKRFLKVVVPLVVYYILYVVAKEGTMWLKPNYWRVLFLRILIGPPEAAPHFWIIYILIGLYVLTPFLRLIVTHIPDEVFCGVIAVVFLINALDTYMPLCGMESPFAVVVDSFAGAFLFGYFLAQTCSPRMENLLIGSGAVSFLITAVLIVCTRDYPNYIYDNAPTMLLFSAALFLSVKRIFAHCTSTQKVVRFLGRYSYSILLIHWGVLHFVVKQLLHVNVLGGGIIGGCLLMIFLTFVLSLSGAVFIDNTIIKLINRIITLIGKGISKIFARR